MVRNLSLLFIIQHFYWASNQSSAGKETEISQFYASTMLDWSIQFCFLNVAVCIFYCILGFLLDRLCWLILIRKTIRGELFNEIKECTSEVVFENRVYLITLQCKSPAPKTGIWTYAINSGIQLREAQAWHGKSPLQTLLFLFPPELSRWRKKKYYYLYYIL